MPELPPQKRLSHFTQERRQTLFPPTGDVRGASEYAELHCRTNFSFLEGASHPDELVQRASELGLSALAVTDRNTLAGVVRAHVAAKEAGLPLLIGAEITPTDAGPVVLLATDRQAYGRLSRLITLGRRRAEKGSCVLTFDDVAVHSEGLVGCVVLSPGGEPSATGLPDKPGPTAHLHQDQNRTNSCGVLGVVPSVRDDLCRYREAFGDRCYGLAELRWGDDDQALLAHMVARAKQSRVPLVAAGDVYYHIPARRSLQDVLTCIRAGSTLAEAGALLFPNAERFLRSPSQMRELFREAPDVVWRTLEVAGRCHFSLDELRYEYPEELCPAGYRAIEYLKELTWRGAQSRYPEGIPEKVRQLLEHELGLIEELKYEAYFLTVWDLVRFARSRGILCQGRGSAANSAVCYCLGVTSVDPNRIDVLFERFLSKDRNEAPDIDVDFEHQRREEVIQYIYAKYGRERAGMTAEVITYQLRSAVRDIGKVLGLSMDRVDRLAKSMDGFRGEEAAEAAGRFREAGLDVDSEVGRQLRSLVPEILDFPRHLSQHVGGMVMTQGPLAELVPLENAAMEGRTVIQWDKDDLDSLGILKVDCLALGMLSAIRRCFAMIESHFGLRYTLATVPAEDSQVYDMICQADTIGVFQIESRAQMSMLPRLAPRCFYDLVIEVAIVRPGPIQGDMVHPYLRRRSGEEEVSYPSAQFESVLYKTLGVPLFQEQAMRLAVVAAGFTPGEADQLRRAMAAWRRKGVIDKFRQKLIDGFVQNGLSQEMGERVFAQIRGFGEYGFPESHAASFALLVYVSAWLKRYYPAAFTASILNSLPMGFYAPAQLVRDARSHGVEVRGPDVNKSDWDCTLERLDPGASDETRNDTSAIAGKEDASRNVALRLGLGLIQGLSRPDGERIVAARMSGGAFSSVDDLARRAKVGRGCLAKLSVADAFGSLALSRRQSLWNSLVDRAPMPLFDRPDDDEEPPLPQLAPQEEVVADYQTKGLTLRAHPISFLRDTLCRLGVVPNKDLAVHGNGRFVRVAGLVLIRQRPSTAKGIHFVTLEDETGVANLIVRPNIWQLYRRIGARASTLLASGRLQRQGLVIHVLVERLQDLSAAMADLRSKSRDFR